MISEDSPRGKFVLLFGPTGSGKSMLVSDIRTRFPDLLFPISYTTRERRPGHENDRYHFVSTHEFNQMREANEFIEWAQFGGNFYSTPKKEVEEGLAAGKVLFKEMELQGVLQTRNILPPEEVVIVYVDAGSWNDLERRVRSRAPITDEELAKRKERYDEEVSYKGIADFIVNNPDGKLEEAQEALAKIIADLLS